MSNYTKTADYAAKDSLPTGHLQKVVRGTELGADFDAIAIAIATKYDSTDLGVTLQGYHADTVTLPPGTAMLFYQNTAPTGWTKVTTSALDNCALRIVSDGSASGGNGGVTGGTATFNAVFGASKSTDNAAADLVAHTHTYSGTTGNDSPDHIHGNIPVNTGAGLGSSGIPASSAGSVSTYQVTGGASARHTHAYSGTTASTGTGGGHSHGLNFDVKYASFIVATKN